jgi:hypothetical protein
MPSATPPPASNDTALLPATRIGVQTAGSASITGYSGENCGLTTAHGGENCVLAAA